MNVKEYRAQVAAGLATAAPATTPSGAAAPVSPETVWRAALATLSNASSTSEARKQALQLLQAGTFSQHEFESVRAEYLDALRRTASDPSEDVRRFALGILMTWKDDFARRKLVEGLQGTAEPLLPPASALSLLARDDHASVGPLAEQVLMSSTDPAVRTQAVRVMANDPGSAPRLQEILRNKDEFREVRRAGAVALKNLNPGLFFQSANEILKDEDEYPDIKSTVSSGLELLVPAQARPGP